MLNTSYPSLCSLNEFVEQLEPAWDSGILTHNGPLLKSLELSVKNTLGIDNYIAVTSGTIALQLAINALEIKGNIIIPAFSWIASAAAAEWENCNIKFCDINPYTLNICINSLEETIDSSVEAIMPVHVFGNPCELEMLDEIAKKNGLKLIYDAAHAFGSTYEGKSILGYGDISCVSTHATKIFNTGEGGGVITKHTSLVEKIKSYRFFGFNEKKEIISNGINGKMTEIHAALGLANLNNFKNTLSHRRKIHSLYSSILSKNNNVRLQKTLAGSNCSYFAIILKDNNHRKIVEDELIENNFDARRYFYPSLNKIDIISDNSDCPISESISESILCLPIHNQVNEDHVIRITNIVNRCSS